MTTAWPTQKIGGTCAANGCEWRVEGRGFEIARPMRLHRESHSASDFPLNDDGEQEIFHFDAIDLSGANPQEEREQP